MGRSTKAPGYHGLCACLDRGPKPEPPGAVRPHVLHDVLKRLRARQDAGVAELQDWLRIPSISADPAHDDDVHAAAEWTLRHLQRAGFQEARLVETPRHPVVVARHDVDPEAPTVTIYGHYDVQPAAREDGWWCDPFEAPIKDGRVWARGSTDDKGQIYAHMLAAEAWIAAGGPPVNLRFVIEGEEESGSENFLAFLEAEQDLLRADLLVVSDSPMRGEGHPAVTQSMRGITVMEVDVHGPRTDLHSGSFGGAVRNPVEALARMLAALKDDMGRIQVPGFYDDVAELSGRERETFAAVAETDDEIAANAGVPGLWGEEGYSNAERVTTRPTLEINGMWGGYTGDGSKTIVPSSAHAKLSCRLVPDQDPDRISDLVEAALQAAAPPEVDVAFRKDHIGWPIHSDPGHPYVAAAAKALQDTWGKAPAFIREGGSIPAVAEMQRRLGAAPLLAGFGHRDENMHGPEESFRIDSFWKGQEASARILDAVAKARQAR